MNLTPIFLIGSGMVVVFLASIIYARRKGCPWRYLGLGALVWLVTVLIAKQFLSAILEPVIYSALYVPGNLWAPGNMVFYMYVGILTGVTEVLLTWLLLRYTRLGKVTWTTVLAFGIGVGAMESLYLGSEYLKSIVIVLINPQAVTATGLNTLSLLNNPIFVLSPIIERVATVLIHVFTSVLIFYAVASRQVRWLWISFIFKSLIDAIVGFAYFWGLTTVPKLLTIEFIIILFALISWWGTNKFQLLFNKYK